MYDCEKCPLSWEDCSYESECYDCGCKVYGDYLGGKRLACCLPEFIKQIISDHKDRERDKCLTKEYADLVEWFESEQKKDLAFRQAVKECIFVNQYGEELVLCRKDENGVFHKVEISDEYAFARMRYEEIVSNNQITELKEETK